MKLPRSGRAQNALILVTSLFLTLVAMALGANNVVDRLLEPARFSLLRHDASHRITVVEMDAASAAAIRRWPWPRENYALVIDRLRQAGAATIVFDVDFSSSSTPAGDTALAKALAQSDGLVVLPTFAQHAGSTEVRSIDSLPLPPFRRHVALASVSITADGDGIVRKAPYGTITVGVPRPSLSAYIAGVAGAADSFFPIDFSIRPDSVPRLSFIAVRDGRFDAGLVKGRTIVIGATAIEMGDRYATPSWGVIPGVVVQALAAETLLAGRPVIGWEFSILLGALLLATLIVRMPTPASLAVMSCLLMAVGFTGVLLAQSWLNRLYPFSSAALLFGIVSVLSALRLTLTQFRRQRLFDEDTRLPTRLAMKTNGEIFIGTQIAVAHLSNLDSLIAVLGQTTANDVMIRIAERLRLAALDDHIYRLGDKSLGFSLSLESGRADSLDGLRTLLLQPVEAAGRKVDVAISVGIATVDGQGIGDTLTRASLAAEKALARGHFWGYDDADLIALEQSVSLMGELDAALVAGEIQVHYQPKMSLHDDRIVSTEALVRWFHPTRGMIRPDHFITMAENAGRITPLTLYVIERAMHDLADLHANGHSITTAINISASLIASPAFNDDVLALLRRDIVPAADLIFEVTESATLEDPEAAIAALERFRAMGIAISMDDYGTGQSTLSYLRTLPLSEVKIDRSFVENAHRNRNDAVMVRSTVDLAHALGLKVVAEGIEEAGCLAFLRSIGCDIAQGYFISKPINALDLRAFLDAGIHSAEHDRAQTR